MTDSMTGCVVDVNNTKSFKREYTVNLVISSSVHISLDRCSYPTYCIYFFMKLESLCSQVIIRSLSEFHKFFPSKISINIVFSCFFSRICKGRESPFESRLYKNRQSFIYSKVYRLYSGFYRPKGVL